MWIEKTSAISSLKTMNLLYLLVINVSPRNLARVITIESYIFSEILVAMFKTVFTKFTMFLSYNSDDAYKVQKSHGLAIHTVAHNTPNERGRATDE